METKTTCLFFLALESQLVFTSVQFTSLMAVFGKEPPIPPHKFGALILS